MEPEVMFENGDCEDCDQDPVKCINLGYCWYDGPCSTCCNERTCPSQTECNKYKVYNRDRFGGRE